MKLSQPTTFSLVLALGTLVAVTSAHADTGYVPYYYTEAPSSEPTTTVATATEVAQPPKLSTPSTITIEAPAGQIITNPSPHPTAQYMPLTQTRSYADGEAGPTQVARAAAVADADTRGTSPSLVLGTREGLDLGFQISNYHYREPSVDVSLAGEKGGITAALTKRMWGNNFFTLDTRFAMGASDYNGSPPSGLGIAANHYVHTSGHFERLFEIRPLFSHDFTAETFNVAPFVGVGFRDFYSDGRGTTTVDGVTVGGYRRTNDMFYVPMGVNTQLRLSRNNRLSLMGEYDYVFSGLQSSTISDADFRAPNLRNVQTHGSGYRASVMWDRPGWSIGPFANYWAMATSDTDSACGISTCLAGYEPHNNTIEVGLQVKIHGLDFN